MKDLGAFLKTNRVWLIGAAVLVALLAFIGAIQGILLPFVLAFVLAYILHPLVIRLQKWHFNRAASTSVVVIGFCLFIVALFLILIPILQSQVFDFMGRVPQLAAAVWNKVKILLLYGQENMEPQQLHQLADTVRQSAFSVLHSIGTSLSRLLSGGMAVFNILTLLLITPIVLFYVLRDWMHVQSGLRELVPAAYKKQAEGLAAEINRTLAGFIRGQATVCIILGFFYAIGLAWAGLELGALIGLLAGILSFVPYFGFGVGLILSILLALTQGADWGLWIGLALVFSIGQILESYFLTPHLVGGNVGLHPVWVIFALLAGGVLFGFTGVLIAVPSAAVIGVLLRHALSGYRASAFYKAKK